jgi:beta-glucosidase-like glycosyl hydrolase/CubicO group peptidase (beta-lactamase class C family)
VIFSRGSSSALKALTDSMQRAARVPLLTAADFEYGPGMRLSDGTRYPSAMALGATRNTDLAYRAGAMVAREMRTLGVMQNYAPVADVNNNPRNPIINTRSFGEQPELVADMAEAWMRGLQDGGVIATAKHFPGHGDTHVDSHTSLPLLSFDRARLDSMELLPFRRLVDAGILSVMTGHLAVSGITGDSTLPATFSRVLLDSLLRESWDFRGLVVTDALNMKALQRLRIRNLPTAAVSAGVDMLLMPEDVSSTVDSLFAALTRGEVDSARVARAVRRVLASKEWALREAPVAPLPGIDGDSAASRLADEIAARAVTVLRNEDGALPLRSDSARVTLLSLYRSDAEDRALRFASLLSSSARVAHVPVAAKDNGRNRSNRLRDSLATADMVLVAAYGSAQVDGVGNIALAASHVSALEEVAALKVPVVFLALGSPYFCTALPSATAYVCTYGDDDASLRAAESVLRGRVGARGTLPVSIPGIAAVGDGLRLPSPDERREAAFADRFAGVDSLMQHAIAQRLFPGAQLLVGTRDGLRYLRSYGALSYDSAAIPVTDSTLYDLASLTKVIATTPSVMLLYEAGQVALDSVVGKYLPEFAVNGKEAVTVRDLLTHSAGFEAFRPFHQLGVLSSDSVRKAVLEAAPVYAPGSETRYSDFSMISLGVLVERVSGTPLDRFVHERIFEPLGMHSTGFRPPDSLRARIAPTEYDRAWRGRLLQGEVHDETAALLGGVAGHAGLFGTASDIGRYAEMLLHEGRHGTTQLFNADVIGRFTQRQPDRGTRALGWDTRSVRGSSAGRYFSSLSYGHTGFTGTSLWIDPVTGVYVVFLCNRVHPSRANNPMPAFRPVLHDAIREALAR